MYFLVAITTVLLGILLFIDFLQTHSIAMSPEIWYERNLIIGKHPSPRRVAIYFGLVGLLSFIIIVVVPVGWACLFSGVFAAIEAVVVWVNFKLGIPLVSKK